MFDRKGDEKRSKRVRSWSGEALGRSSYLKNSPLKIIEYTYLRNRERNKSEGKRDKIHKAHTHIHIFMCTTQIPRCKEPLLDQK